MPPLPLALAPTLAVEPWDDPVIDQLGHDPRSPYAERFWLAILGPSTMWLLRRLADGLDRSPEGFTLDLAETARSIGVGMRGGRSSPFMRSLERSCRFGAARLHGTDTLVVRRKLAPLAARQVSRLPEPLQHEHLRWATEPPERAPSGPTPEQTRTRARQLAQSLLEIGEEPTAAERQLHQWRFHPAVAYEAVHWARGRLATAEAARDGATGSLGVDEPARP
jgi:hypothetical protein